MRSGTIAISTGPGGATVARELTRASQRPVVRGVTVGGSSMYCFATAWDPSHALLDAHGVDLRGLDQAKRELRPQPGEAAAAAAA